MRYAVILAAAMLALLLVGCGGGGGPSPEALEAVRTVASAPELAYGDPMPVVDRDHECVIYGGGPYPGMRLSGKCRWDAEKDDSGWIVSYTQSWRCEDFSGLVQGYKPCDGEWGKYTSRYRVDAKGNVSFVDAGGQFYPGMAE